MTISPVRTLPSFPLRMIFTTPATVSSRHSIAFHAILLVTVIAVITPLCGASDPVFLQETVSDSNGNSADADSNINWAPLPENQPYKTNTEYDDGGLTPLYNFAKHFVSTVQPNEFPYGKDISLFIWKFTVAGFTSLVS